MNQTSSSLESETALALEISQLNMISVRFSYCKIVFSFCSADWQIQGGGEIGELRNQRLFIFMALFVPVIMSHSHMIARGFSNRNAYSAEALFVDTINDDLTALFVVHDLIR